MKSVASGEVDLGILRANSADAAYFFKIAELKKAKSQLIKAVTIKNDISEFHYNLAYVYKNLNKPKLAQAYLDNYNKLTSY